MSVVHHHVRLREGTFEREGEGAALMALTRDWGTAVVVVRLLGVFNAM